MTRSRVCRRRSRVSEGIAYEGVMRFGRKGKLNPRYVFNPSHVFDFEPIELTPELAFEERPIRVLAREERRLRTRSIPMVKVKWLNHSEEEATWETEADMRALYPELFGT
ncbi:uncharacterized protein [Henckelia pumila]|uniref:uncharacterized protein n=1 Tax=Henckelia pumila TaxID=405737 RepID=UPI003C6E736C